MAVISVSTRRIKKGGRALAAAALLLFLGFHSVNAQYNYLGEIRMFAGGFAPTGWALCNGQLLSISQNTALFSILGTTYGGDGKSTFGLPDLRGRVPMHPGAGTGLSARALGDMGGQETVTLTAAQMPVHTHAVTVAVDSLVATSDNPLGAVPARNASATPSYGKTVNATLLQTAVTVAPSGGGQPHPTMPPFACVNFIIALTGIFPSQN